MDNEELAHNLTNGYAAAVLDVVDSCEFGKNKLIRAVEPLIHEVCHAVSLGFSVEDGVSGRTSDYFKMLNRRSVVLGLITEAHAFAIERHVLHKLGWLPFVRLGDLMRNIHKTGYSGPAIPLPEFMSIYRRFLREARTHALANQAVGHIQRLAWASVE